MTEAGRFWIGRVQTLLDQLAEATADLQRLEAPKALVVSGGPSFVACWLIPRLGRLNERHCQLDVRVLASAHLNDLAREQIDVASIGRIRWDQNRFRIFRSFS
jgi:LysR family transcriptional regulator, glycine cleavage system transcriptional activator